MRRNLAIRNGLIRISGMRCLSPKLLLRLRQRILHLLSRERAGDTQRLFPFAALSAWRVSEILCERHTMMLPRSMYATQEEDAGCDAGH